MVIIENLIENLGFALELAKTRRNDAFNRGRIDALIVTGGVFRTALRTGMTNEELIDCFVRKVESDISVFNEFGDKFWTGRLVVFREIIKELKGE